MSEKEMESPEADVEGTESNSEIEVNGGATSNDPKGWVTPISDDMSENIGSGGKLIDADKESPLTNIDRKSDVRVLEGRCDGLLVACGVDESRKIENAKGCSKTIFLWLMSFQGRCERQ